MSDGKSELSMAIEDRFADIGGFKWEQAEAWAGFCDAVGMDPLPFLKVILNKLCTVKVVSAKDIDSSRCSSPELRVMFKGSRTKFKLAEPAEKSSGFSFISFGI